MQEINPKFTKKKKKKKGEREHMLKKITIAQDNIYVVQ